MTLVELLPLVAIAAVFWLLILRPASVRRRAQAALVASLARGARVMTTAGVFGTVVAVDDARVRVEIAPGVVIEMLAQAIAEVLPAESADRLPADKAPADQAPGDQGTDDKGTDDQAPVSTEAEVVDRG